MERFYYLCLSLPRALSLFLTPCPAGEGYDNKSSRNQYNYPHGKLTNSFHAEDVVGNRPFHYCVRPSVFSRLFDPLMFAIIEYENLNLYFLLSLPAIFSFCLPVCLSPLLCFLYLSISIYISNCKFFSPIPYLYGIIFDLSHVQFYPSIISDNEW